MQIVHVKLSFQTLPFLKKKAYSHGYAITKEGTSYYIIRSLKYPFVYHINTSGHINFSGVKSFSEIAKAQRIFNEAVNVISVFKAVDNITVKLFIKQNKIFIPRLVDYLTKEKCAESNITEVRFDSNIFCGVFIKFQNGTVLAFKSAKCMLVGVKKRKHIQFIEDTINVILDEYDV